MKRKRTDNETQEGLQQTTNLFLEAQLNGLDVLHNDALVVSGVLNDVADDTKEIADGVTELSTEVELVNTNLNTLQDIGVITNTNLSAQNDLTTTSNTVLGTINANILSSNDMLASTISAIYAVSKPTFDGVGFKIPDSYSGATGITYGGYRYTTKLLATSCATAFLNSEKTAVPKLTGGAKINVPTEDVTLAMSSSSASDVGIQLVFQYYDASYTSHYALFILNGQTSVTGINPFNPSSAASKGYRFTNGIVVYSPFTALGGITLGDLYLYPAGTSISAGVPTNLSLCLATGLAGEGLLNSGYISVPPAYQFFPTEVVISTNTSGNNVDLQLAFYTQTGNTSGWRRLAKLNVSNYTATVSLHQAAFTNISTDFSGTQGSDMMVSVNRKSGASSSNSVDISVYMSGYAVVAV